MVAFTYMLCFNLSWVITFINYVKYIIIQYYDDHLIDLVR